MSIAIAGFRGCGKSTVGRLLAQRLGWGFVDTDELLVQRAGKNIKEIFAQHGEEHFRDLETQAVREAVAMPNQVIGLGGGALVREENRQAIRQAGVKVVYLRCDEPIRVQRIRNDLSRLATRPNRSDPAWRGRKGLPGHGNLELAQHERLFRQMASIIVDVTDLSTDEAADRIESKL